MMIESSSKALILSCSLLVVGLMMMDFFNPTFPVIMRSMGSSQILMKNMVVLYMLILGVAQLVYGAASDHYGRRPLIIIGLFVAVVGLMASAFCSSIWELYLARSITAFGAASCTVISRAIILDAYKTQGDIKSAFSYFTLSSQLSPAIAPIIGAYIAHRYGWRASFICLGAMVLAATVFILASMPEYNKKRYASSFLSCVKTYSKIPDAQSFYLYSFSSAVIFSFTIGFYVASPYALDAEGFNQIQISYFFSLYALGIFMGAFTSSRFTADRADVLYSALLLTMFIVLIVFYNLSISTWYIIALFSFLVAFLGGASAPLSMFFCMRYIKENKGVAGALQGSLKMFFAGIMLVFFDYVYISSMSSLVSIFLVFSVFLMATNGYLLYRGRVLFRA